MTGTTIIDKGSGTPESVAMTASPPSFATTAFTGAMVTGGAQLLKIIIQFLSVIVMSRLLAPEDFGLVASIMPLIIFVSTFQEIGLQQAVVQRPEIREDQLNSIFWILSAVGAACFLIVAMLGPAAAWFYNDDRLWKLAIVAGIPIIINNFNAIHLSLMNRHMRFKALAVLDVLGAVGGFLAALAGALCGLEYWSIMLNPIAMALIICIGANILTHWRPSRPAFSLDKDIFSFGAHLTGFNLIVFLGRNLDVLLIGRYLGASLLGYYDRAQKLVNFPIQNINAPLARVILPVLSRIQNDKARLRRTFMRTVRVLTLISVPGIAAVAASAEAVVLVLLGEKWLPVSSIIAWTALSTLTSPLGFAAQWILLAQGQTKIILYWGLFTAITMIIAALIGIQWGLTGLVIAYFVRSYFVFLPAQYWMQHKVGPVTAMDLVKTQFPLLAAAALTWVTTHYIFIDNIGMSGISLIIATVVASYLYSILISVIHSTGRETLHDTLNIIMEHSPLFGRKA